jgi:hypothetical protein
VKRQTSKLSKKRKYNVKGDKAKGKSKKAKMEAESKAEAIKH